MKNFLLGIYCLTLNAVAQQINVKTQFSAVFKDEHKISKIQLAAEDGEGGVILGRSYVDIKSFRVEQGFCFEHYDKDLKLIKEYKYESKQKSDEKNTTGSILGFIPNGKEISIIEFLYDKKNKLYVCNALTSTISDFNFIPKELFRITADEVNRKGFISVGSGSRDNDRDIGAKMIFNQEETAFAITFDIRDKANETHKLYLFDKALNLKINHTFKRDIKDKNFTYENVEVSSDGSTLYLLGKVYTDELKKNSEGAKYEFELTQITNETEKKQVFTTKQHFSNSLKTFIIGDKLICIGLYSDIKDNRYKGISYFELDPNTLNIKKEKFNPFTEQFMNDKYGKDSDNELKFLSFRGVIITPSNEIVFNAEESYITYQRAYGASITTSIYHYDDIVSAKLNSSGDIIWARNINKRQISGQDDSYVSYTSMIQGNDTYFFINAGEKVKKLSNDRIQFGQNNYKKSNLNVIRINQKGDFDYQEIIDGAESEVSFMVSDGVVVNDTIFFLGKKGKKKQLLKITL